MLNMFCAMEALPIVVMILVDFAIVGAGTLSKAAMTSGLSQYVYIAYFDTLATLIFLPWFVYHCLSGKRLPLNFSLLCRFFALSLIGKCFSPIFVHTGLRYTSVTVGAAIANLTPIFTYLIAVSLRMERLDLRRSTDQIKGLGTVVAVTGALVVTLYKGPALLVTHTDSNATLKLRSGQTNWLLGCLFYTMGYLLRSIWHVFQADTIKLYPDEITTVFFCTLFGSMQTATATFFLVKDQSAWRLHHKIEIIAIVYAAFSLSIIANIVMTWCLRKKGPVFVSMFDPLKIATASFMGFVFLGDGVYLGSVIGSAAIIVGFYAVMWGQERTTHDMVKKTGGLESAYSCSQVTPLLQSSCNKDVSAFSTS